MLGASVLNCSIRRRGWMQTITYIPIGVIRSPFTTLAGMPIQTVAAA
jgi:hypothetical protein